jgi:hypothetical protein
MNIPESFYVALCMTVLLVGVVYWFWSQNQYIQRKINLLENIVYEMKELYTNRSSFVGPPAEIKHTKYSPPAYVEPEHQSDEEIHKKLISEVEHEVELVEKEEEAGVEKHQTIEELMHEEKNEELNMEQPFFPPMDSHDDLQPGGVGSGLKGVEVSDQSSSLDGMTVKELRRLAEQRGIENAGDFRKKELIAKLRALASPPAPSVFEAFDQHESQQNNDDIQSVDLEIST